VPVENAEKKTIKWLCFLCHLHTSVQRTITPKKGCLFLIVRIWKGSCALSLRQGQAKLPRDSMQVGAAEIRVQVNSHDSSVGTVTRLLGGRPRKFDSVQSQEIFRFFIASIAALEPSQRGREADHSPPSSAEVKNMWSYTSTTSSAFMAWCLIKHRDNLTLRTNIHTNTHTPLNKICIYIWFSEGLASFLYPSYFFSPYRHLQGAIESRFVTIFL
jgi:hypothetical protein